MLETGAGVVQSVGAGELRASPWWQGGECAGVVLLGPVPPEVAAEPFPADLTTLAAGLAHEVKNPLAALRGAAELMVAELDSGQPASREYLDLMLREVNRVDALLSRLLQAGRPLVPVQTRVSPAKLLHELAIEVRALAAARGLSPTVEEQYDPALPELQVDGALLFSALVNLAKNAVEALPAAEGRIVLGAFVEPGWRRLGEGGRPRAMVKLTVRDNGTGLAGASEKLFTPFFTTKATGTGLGLVVARRVVEAHAGLLSLHDAAPGVEARILLPL